MSNDTDDIRLRAWALQERMFRGAQANQQRVGEIAGATRLSDVEWPTVEHYGYDHAKQTAQLAFHVGTVLGLSTDDLLVVKAAGLFHDLGRRAPWRTPDSDHQRRSADLALVRLRADPEWSHRHGLHAQVAEVIGRHRLTLDGPQPTDPRLICLWDAECYEALRFAPNTPEGRQWADQWLARVATEWARHPDHQRRWRSKRGWE